MVAMIYSSLHTIILIVTEKEVYPDSEQSVAIVKIVINAYLLVVILFHYPVVLLQDYS